MEYWTIIKFVAKKTKTPTEFFEEISTVYGESGPSFATIKCWELRIQARQGVAGSWSQVRLRAISISKERIGVIFRNHLYMTKGLYRKGRKAATEIQSGKITTQAHGHCFMEFWTNSVHGLFAKNTRLNASIMSHCWLLSGRREKKRQSGERRPIFAGLCVRAHCAYCKTCWGRIWRNQLPAIRQMYEVHWRRGRLYRKYFFYTFLLTF